MPPKTQDETSVQWQPPGGFAEILAGFLCLLTTIIFLTLLQGKYFDFGVPMVQLPFLKK